MSVSPLHVYLEFLAEKNAADLLEIQGLGEYAVGAVIRIEKAAFTDVAPVERRADLVIFIDGPNPLVLIFEIQLRRDEDKPTAWNSYIAHAYARWKCQVALVVLTPSDAVATWASQPIRPHIGSSWTPFVLGPADMPLNWTVQDVSERLDLAILCAATHGNKREAEQLCTQVWYEMVQRMDGGRIESTRYTDYLDVLASVATRHWVQGFLEKDVDYIRLSERLEKKAKPAAAPKAQRPPCGPRFVPSLPPTACNWTKPACSASTPRISSPRFKTGSAGSPPSAKAP